MVSQPEGTMFFRSKKSGQRTYLQVVENRWENGQSRQQVIATLGRLDQLLHDGQLDALLLSGARFSQTLLLLSAHAQGHVPVITTRHIGPALLFERLWQETGCRAVIDSLLAGRKFEFPLERAIFLTVLHRLFAPGSDRAADQWRQDYEINGCEALQLHHLYRAMAWLGEELPDDQQGGRTPFAPRCLKDLVEEGLFRQRQDLFTGLDLVFFDTTSIYFEGEGGESLGEHGHSKDHRPDLKQLVVGAVLDKEGRPLCCELWPGNTTDVKTLVPIVDRLQQRFGIQRVCIVADRGMISKETVTELEKPERGWQYILGARMRSQNEVKDEVLSRGGRYQVVHAKGPHRKDPSPLKVKEVWVADRRYVVCLNEDEARKDAADREAIVTALREKLRSGDKSLIGNRGYRRFVATESESHFQIDEAKIAAEARYDGKWVLRTNTELAAADVALQFKRLWMVEHWFRSCKTLLATRPIYHKCDETIRGHVFCSFLALVLRQELQARLEARGDDVEWADVIRDVDQLQVVEVEQDGKRFLLRSETKGTCGKAFQAAGVALPPTVRQITPAESSNLSHGATPNM
jgi:Transposase DDE domain